MLLFKVDLKVPSFQPRDVLLLSVEQMALQFVNHNRANRSVLAELDKALLNAELTYQEERFEQPRVGAGISFDEALEILTPIAPHHPEAIGALTAAIWQKANTNVTRVLSGGNI